MISPSLLPEEFRESFCIAGGFAACPVLANDIDVWVYGIDTDQLEDARNIILSYLNNGGANDYNHVPEAGDESQVAYEHGMVHIKKVAVLKRGPLLKPNRRYKPIHIMVTDAHNPGDIIDGFDIGTHAVAIDHDGRVWKHRHGWDAPHQRPSILRVNVHTQKRLDKITHRFGHETWDVGPLTSSITEEDGFGND
jgi:hypothetical protein